MPDTFHWNDTTTVSRDGVTVERELEGREDGIIVTLDLESDEDGPLEVALSDEFPPELPAEQVGFNVEHEPEEGDLTLERAELRHTVEGGRARIVYAIRLAEPVSRLDFGEPVIEEVSVPGGAETDVGAGAPARESGPSQGSPVVSSSGPADDAGQSEDLAGAVSGDGQGRGTRDDTGSPDDAGSPEDAGDSGDTDPLGDGTDEADASDGFDLGADDRSGDADPDDVSSAIERAIEETESTGMGGEADGGESPDAVPGSGPDGQRPVDDAGAGPTAQRTSGSPPSDEAPGAHSTPAGGRPGRGGSAGPAGERGRSADEEVSRSVRLRLDWLSARVEEFATYAEALEEIIEREGTGPEILEALEDDIATVDERLEEVRMDLDALQTEHAADVDDVSDRVDEVEERFEAARSELRSDVDAVRATVDELDADVDRVDDRAAENESAIESVGADVESVESALEALEDRVGEHDEDLTDVAEGVESVESELSELTESVEEMREDLESMQVDVQRLLRFREILADVFGGPMQLADDEDGDAEALGGTDEESPAADGSLSTPSGRSDH